VAIAAGQNHSLALKSNGEVWAWGANNVGQLGGATTNAISSTTPVQIPGLSEIIAIATHSDHSLALKKDGTVWAWGPNDDGELGDGTTITPGTPVKVKDLVGVTAIATGLGHSLAVKADGTVWAWGRNESGELGFGTTDNTPHPTPGQVQVQPLVESSAHTPIVGVPSVLTEVKDVAAGESFSLALNKDGTVLWAWGLNSIGQLGDGTENMRVFPKQVSMLSGVVTAIAAGDAHSLAAETNDNVQDWGSNIGGQLGNGNFNPSPVPVPVANLQNNLGSVICVAGGLRFSLALGPATLLTVTEILRNAPGDPNESPRFNLLVDGSVVKGNITEGSSQPQSLSPGTHTVSETPASANTHMSDFTTVIGGACTATGTIALAPADNKTCTITNFDHNGGCGLGQTCCEGGVGQQGCQKCQNLCK
jgi:hypothetical protein